MQLWDLAKGECESTLSYHSDKVQSLAWNPEEASVLLSGAFGGAVCICDTRGGELAVATWAAGTDVESVAWGHSACPTKFAVRTFPVYTYTCIVLAQVCTSLSEFKPTCSSSKASRKLLR